MKYNPKTQNRHNHPRKSELENNLLYEIRMGGMGDSWGVCTGWLFSIADFLDPWGMVPAEWEYRQGVGGPDEESHEYQAIVDLVDEGSEADAKDVLAIGETLFRWRGMLETAGKSY